MKRRQFISKSVAGLAAATFLSFGFKKEELDIKKNNVRIGWEVTGERKFDKVLTEKIINDIKAKPTTGSITAYVTNDDARGSSKEVITAMVNYLIERRKQGVTFEQGVLYVDAFEEAAAIKAKQQLNLTIDLWSNRERLKKTETVER